MEMGGWTFFWLYILLNIGLFFAALRWREKIRRSDCRSSPRMPELTLYEMAYLAEANRISKVRTCYVALTRLLAQQDIELSSQPGTSPCRIKLLKPIADFADPIERLVAQAIQDSDGVLTSIRLTFRQKAPPLMQPIDDRLQQLNLLLDPKVAKTMREWPSFLFVLSGLFGLVRVFIAIDQGRSVWLQAIVCAVIFFTARGFGQGIGGRSVYGDKVLQELQTERRKLVTRTLPTNELAMSVALLGSIILYNSALSQLIRNVSPPPKSELEN